MKQIKTVTLDSNQKPTEEQIWLIEEAAKREIVFDEDSPELTPAMEKAFRLAAKNRNAQKNIIAAMNEFQSIIGENTGWDSEEDMLKDMADFRRGRLSRRLSI